MKAGILTQVPSLSDNEIKEVNTNVNNLPEK